MSVIAMFRQLRCSQNPRRVSVTVVTIFQKLGYTNPGVQCERFGIQKGAPNDEKLPVHNHTVVGCNLYGLLVRTIFKCHSGWPGSDSLYPCNSNEQERRACPRVERLQFFTLAKWQNADSGVGFGGYTNNCRQKESQGSLRCLGCARKPLYKTRRNAERMPTTVSRCSHDGKSSLAL